MKNLKFLLLTFAILIVGTPVAEAVVRPVEAGNTAVSAEKKETSKKELRLQRKAMKQEVKQAVRDWKKEGATDTDTLLLVIIAILLPPLAMAIYDGISGRFWLSLLLTLLFYLPGLIYTLVIILGGK